jgi:hypothetical protein
MVRSVLLVGHWISSGETLRTLSAILAGDAFRCVRSGSCDKSDVRAARHTVRDRKTAQVGLALTGYSDRLGSIDIGTPPFCRERRGAPPHFHGAPSEWLRIDSHLEAWDSLIIAAAESLMTANSELSMIAAKGNPNLLRIACHRGNGAL